MSDTAYMPPIAPDDTAFPVDPAPIRARLQVLDEKQGDIVRRWWGNALGDTTLDALDWAQLRQVAAMVGAGESDTGAKAPRELRDELLNTLEALNPVARAVAKTCIANYNIGHTSSMLLTTGEVDTAMYVLAHHGDVWASARDLADDATPVHTGSDFEKVGEDARVLAEAKASADQTVEANAKAPLEELPDDLAPADWDDPVPHGGITRIIEWVDSGLEGTEEHRVKAHRAMIAEVRRRGLKQRKGLLKALDRIIGPGWVAPYMRAELPDADTLPHPLEVAEGTALHVVITAKGVRYWSEAFDDA